jgi:hypothetical protein
MRLPLTVVAFFLTLPAWTQAAWHLDLQGASSKFKDDGQWLAREASTGQVHALELGKGPSLQITLGWTKGGQDWALRAWRVSGDRTLGPLGAVPFSEAMATVPAMGNFWMNVKGTSQLDLRSLDFLWSKDLVRSEGGHLGFHVGARHWSAAQEFLADGSNPAPIGGTIVYRLSAATEARGNGLLLGLQGARRMGRTFSVSGRGTLGALRGSFDARRVDTSTSSPGSTTIYRFEDAGQERTFRQFQWEFLLHARVGKHLTCFAGFESRQMGNALGDGPNLPAGAMLHPTREQDVSLSGLTYGASIHF